MQHLRACLRRIALAGAVATAAGLPAPAAWAVVEVIGTTDPAVSLPVSQGKLVRLNGKASTVFVADPEIADVQVKSPSLVYLLAKKPGTTTLFAVDGREVVLASLDIAVIPDVVRLRTSVAQLHPDLDVRVSVLAQSVVLDGAVPSALEAESIRRLAVEVAGAPERVVNRLVVTAPSQINLRVRVTEISRDVRKQLGFNWQAVGSLGGFAFGLFTQNPFANNVIQHALTASGSLGGVDLNAVVDALEQEGLIKVLAEPNLTAMSGETASFLAGGEFPILVPDANGRVTIEFKKFGVSLGFNPTLVGTNRINLHVRPEVSQTTNVNAVVLNDFQIPALTTRRAETTVELASGQSFAIAGLLQSDVTHDVSKFPGLGDLPVLGALFRSEDFQRNETELVIIVTPYLVEPVSARAMAAPTDGFLPPHDVERLLFGGTWRQSKAAGPQSTVAAGGRQLIGPVGFQIE